MTSLSQTYRLLASLTLLSLLAACSTAPKVSEDKVGQSEADTWFNKYCSNSGLVGVMGELVIKSDTKEFKGQFPASVAFKKDGTFNLEITNIVGGTVAQLSGDSRAMQITVPSKKQYNRSGVTHYLGLEMAVLVPLLRGELPCPTEARTKGVRVQAEGNAMRVRTTNWDWYFYRSLKDQGEVPARVVLKSPNGKQTIEMDVENWNDEEKYLKKGHVHSPEGDLKWTWRDRMKS
ncbi:MAG: hypothetical protein JST80_12945 [Bdellovibrionales bacterium]|nr:hypothetical protein [Bdellovibrionales bacterium]